MARRESSAGGGASLWRKLNRELPRRYTNAVGGLLLVICVIVQLLVFSHSPEGIPMGGWCIAIALISLGLFLQREAVHALCAKFRQRRHHARRVRGLCGHCGYALRGKNGFQCPECGMRHGRWPMNDFREAM